MSETQLPDLTNREGVLFDLDGVLTPTSTVHMRAWRQVFEQLFAQRSVQPSYADSDYYLHLDGKKRYDGVKSLLGSRHIDLPWGDPSDAPEAETICGVGNRKNDAFLAVLEAEGIQPYPGSLALLDRLIEAGVKVAVVSSSKNAEQVLEAAGIRDRFEVIVDGVVAEREGLPSKPAPDVFLAAARMLDIDPAHSAAIEDATSGVASAEAAGFADVIGVDRGAGELALIDAGATVIVSDLAEFTD